MDWNLVLSTVAILGALGTAVWKIGRWIAGVDSKLDVLVFLHRNELLEQHQHSAPPPPGNPYTAEERDLLLLRLRQGTITQWEARRLQAILEEERAYARRTDNGALALLIVGLLVLVAVYLGNKKA